MKTLGSRRRQKEIRFRVGELSYDEAMDQHMWAIEELERLGIGFSETIDDLQYMEEVVLVERRR